MTRRDWRLVLFLYAAVAASFALFYGGASALSGLVPWRVRVDLPFEHDLPFVPWSAVVYLSMDALLLLSAFVFKDSRQLAAFAALLIVETLVAAPVFVLLPVADVFAPRAASGVAGVFFQLADTMNLERNYLPSLHVAFSVTAAKAYGGRWWWLWAVAIAASTVLMKEHYVVDVLAGAALALLVYRLLFTRLVQFDLAEAITTEWLVIKALTRLGLRHRRYAIINLALYALAVPRFRTRRVLRTGYALLQIIDDVLDGDRESVEPPLQYAARATTMLQTGAFTNDELGRLCRAFHRDAPAAAFPVALELIAVMCRDHERMTTRARWSQDEIHAQLRATFVGSLDVLLICGGAKARAHDLPHLVDLLGWASAVRDLDEDAARGLHNVPVGVDRATWLANENARAHQLLAATRAELAALPEATVAKWLRVIAESTTRYLRPT